mmetsp:Transcript_30997/g.90356  ORF Transcript_30997/g.90356 Transcript_30997/m.90356 type:complete len:271 (-) Transcript_30997:1069-1881(-)
MTAGELKPTATVGETGAACDADRLEGDMGTPPGEATPTACEANPAAVGDAAPNIAKTVPAPAGDNGELVMGRPTKPIDGVAAPAVGEKGPAANSAKSVEMFTISAGDPPATLPEPAPTSVLMSEWALPTDSSLNARTAGVSPARTAGAGTSSAEPGEDLTGDADDATGEEVEGEAPLAAEFFGLPACTWRNLVAQETMVCPNSKFGFAAAALAAPFTGDAVAAMPKDGRPCDGEGLPADFDRRACPVGWLVAPANREAGEPRLKRPARGV